MGLWKRFSEKTRQAMGFKAEGVDWRPTSNARNLAMLEEVRRFSKQLKTLHRELRVLEDHVQVHFGVVKGVLMSPLPRSYELSDKGPVPLEREAVYVGTGVNYEVFPAATSDLKARLRSEVLYPLDQWLSAYRSIKARNTKVEELRLELDASRREMVTMAVNVSKIKDRAGTSAVDAGPTGGSLVAAGPTGGAPTSSNKVEDAEFRLQKHEDKVTRMIQRFRDVEEEVYSALLTLINDTKVLKQYAAVGMTVFQHVFYSAHSAFDGGEARPLPISSPAAATNFKPSSAYPGMEALPRPINGPSVATNSRPPSTYPGTPAAGVNIVMPQTSSSYFSSPITPENGAAPPPAPASPIYEQLEQPSQEHPPPPAWYIEAQQQPQPTNYNNDCGGHHEGEE